MAHGNFYKPRNSIVYVTKSKVWPNKTAYLRRFYDIRARWLHRRDKLFSRCVLVATTRKWIDARRRVRPYIQISGSRKRSFGNHTVFGRPTKDRYRYRNNFYAKQQLRAFYGEVKETVFRNFYKKYHQSVTLRNKAFFSGLESRLDILFFRRRLLPTIFACRQFIFHQGLEVNSVVENSPRALIRTGDRISVPHKAWKSLYWDLFIRVYYRTWGLYIRRRRLKKQLKKIRFLVRRDCFKSQRSALFSFFKINTFKTKKYKNPITEKVNPINVISSFNSDRRFQSNHFEHESRELVDYEALALFAGSEDKQPVEKPVEKPIKKVYDLNARDATLQDIFALNPSADITLKLFSNYSSFFYKRYVAIIRKTIKHTLQKKDLREDNQRLMHFSKMAFNLVSYIKTNRLESKKNNLFAIKRVQFQKLVFSLRFRKSKLPVGLRYRQKTDEKTGQRSFISKLIRKNNDYFMRSKLIRFYRKKRKKRIHNKKIIRLKGVHFFIPSYLQIDFRTLRAVKVQSPGQENIVYPFRISLSKRYAFYRSKRY